MNSRKGVMAAIMTAVTAYIEVAQEAPPAGVTAPAKAKPEAPPVAPRRRPPSVVSLWRSSGREEIMRMRTLWQRRIV